MNAAIDLGNSFAKYARFEGDHLIELFDRISLSKLIDVINDEPPAHLIISTVNQQSDQVLSKIDHSISVLKMHADIQTPIKNNYITKETLGQDRLAAVVGANFLKQNQNVLVIDAGTCITYDIVDQNGEYHGGAISPGIGMKARAMHEFTANLPLVNVETQAELVGNSTKSSMLSGILNGTSAEIMQMIRMYASKFGDLQVLMCGGDAENLKKNVSDDVTLVPDLVLIGLNRIINYHVEKI